MHFQGRCLKQADRTRMFMCNFIIGMSLGCDGVDDDERAWQAVETDKTRCIPNNTQVIQVYLLPKKSLLFIYIYTAIYRLYFQKADLRCIVKSTLGDRFLFVYYLNRSSLFNMSNMSPLVLPVRGEFDNQR